MNEQHKATPEEWATIEELGRNNFHAPSCILELRARVEALEANHPEIPHSSAPAGSLVERVQATIDGIPYGEEAPAAIREVAAWLVEKYSDTDECLESLIGVVVGEIQAEAER